MNKVWIGIAAALLVSACGGRGFLGGNQASVEQRDLFEKQEAQKKEAEAAEQKMKEEQVRKEQEELKKQLAAQQAQAQKDGGADAQKNGAGGVGTGGAGDQMEQPTVTPLPPTTLTEQSLKETMAAMNDPSNPLSKRSIYFGYDSMSVEEEYTQIIESHAKFLAEHPQIKVRVEGNTDVRGSREYNLALGQRRADSVKRAFTLHGVSADQVESVSFGEEKPRMQGESEDAHQENRRVDIVYSAKDVAQ